jgi:ubiquinone/menaquinone biosynthesis C-methylase UbiE
MDIAQEMLEVAEANKYQCFLKGKPYSLPFQNGCFNGGLAGFWFSHIPKKKSSTLLERLSSTSKEKIESVHGGQRI